MRNPRLRAMTLALTIAIGLTTAGCLDRETADPIVGPELGILAGEHGSPHAFEVYTQNMFLGGETGPLFSIDFAILDDPTHPDFLSEFQELLAAVNGFWDEVQASDIPGRVHEIVNEIDARRPHIVALQEAVGFALVTPTFDPLPGQDFVAQDLLLSVQAEIAARQLPYQVAVVRTATQGALPMAVDPVTFQPTTLLSFTDRVVMLVRNDVEVAQTDDALYGCALCKIPLGIFDFVRGWARVTVEQDGTPYHFVATHLETQATRPVHDAQADELQAILAGLDGNVVLMGDLNSDAAAEPTAPSWTPTYGELVDAGFVDVWEEAPRRGTASGATCCLKEGSTFDQRIDFVLLRPAAGGVGGDHDGDGGLRSGFYRAEVVGDQPEDQTASGQWPSDHAGISASIRQPGAIR